MLLSTWLSQASNAYTSLRRPQMGRSQFYAIQGTVRIAGQNQKFSVRVNETIAKGIQSKDQKIRSQAFTSLAARVKESLNKKRSQTGSATVDDEVTLKEQDFTVKTVRFV